MRWLLRLNFPPKEVGKEPVKEEEYLGVTAPLLCTFDGLDAHLLLQKPLPTLV